MLNGGAMTRRSRAKIVMKVLIALLLITLGMLIVAAREMNHRYGGPAADEDTSLLSNAASTQALC